MKQLSSIYQFFSEINCNFQCYEMGRFIQSINQQSWEDFEQNKTPWASPFLQHAWIGLIFWENVESEKQGQDLNHTVWFLKLPLDEQAQLSLIARDDFLRHLVETLGQYLQQKTHKKENSTDSLMYSLENTMKDNPYGFQPKQEAMANFHAIVHQQLGLDSSPFYHATQAYLADIVQYEKNNTQVNNDSWQQLGLQGFADLTARLNEKYQGKSNQQLLIESINYLHLAVLNVLGLCLENHKISTKLQYAIVDLALKNIKHNTSDSLASLCALSIRATAQSSDKKLQTQFLQEVLNSSIKTDIEVLVSISGRCWTQLSENKTLKLYLEAISITDKEVHPGAFSAILTDLMFIPGMRENILQVFRSPERSAILSKAIAAFFSLTLNEQHSEIQ